MNAENPGNTDDQDRLDGGEDRLDDHDDALARIARNVRLYTVTSIYIAVMLTLIVILLITT